jgi:hypothetical protein
LSILKAWERGMARPVNWGPGCSWFSRAGNKCIEQLCIRPREQFTTEQIIHWLREPQVGLAKGRTIAEVCEVIDVTDQTYYRWRKEFGALNMAWPARCCGARCSIQGTSAS